MHEDDLYGPPTAEEDLWFLEHVVAAGYPKVKRDPEPMPGQMSVYDALKAISEIEPDGMTQEGRRRVGYHTVTHHLMPLPEEEVSPIECWCGEVHTREHRREQLRRKRWNDD